MQTARPVDLASFECHGPIALGRNDFMLTAPTSSNFFPCVFSRKTDNTTPTVGPTCFRFWGEIQLVNEVNGRYGNLRKLGTETTELRRSSFMDGHVKKCLGKMATDRSPDVFLRKSSDVLIPGKCWLDFFFVLKNSPICRWQVVAVLFFGKVGGVGFLNEFPNRNPILARRKVRKATKLVFWGKKRHKYNGELFFWGEMNQQNKHIRII